MLAKIVTPSLRKFTGASSARVVGRARELRSTTRRRGDQLGWVPREVDAELASGVDTGAVVGGQAE